MRKTYKNKRDYYKAESIREKERAKIFEAKLKATEETLERERKWKREAEEKRKNANKQRYESTTYCSNCKMVTDVLIPNGMQINDCNCIVCGVKSSQIAPTLFHVIKYPGKIFI